VSIKVRRYIEYMDGTVVGVVITAGDEERARRRGLTRNSEEFNIQALWSAAKRNALPNTDGTGEDAMLDWLDTVARWDIYFTPDELAEIALNDPEQAEAMKRYMRDLGEA